MSKIESAQSILVSLSLNFNLLIFSNISKLNFNVLVNIN